MWSHPKTLVPKPKSYLKPFAAATAANFISLGIDLDSMIHTARPKSKRRFWDSLASECKAKRVPQSQWCGSESKITRLPNHSWLVVLTRTMILRKKHSPLVPWYPLSSCSQSESRIGPASEAQIWPWHFEQHDEPTPRSLAQGLWCKYSNGPE